MTQRMPAFLALAFAVVLPQGRALLLAEQKPALHLQRHQHKSSDLSCLCMNWADVYKSHGVTCGQGMELFALMDKMNVSLTTDLRKSTKVLLAKSSDSANSALETLKQLPVYMNLCTNFFQRANFNYCVNKRYMKTADQKKKPRGTWCYTSNNCKLPSVTPIPGTDLGAKQCSEAFDVSIGDMLVEDQVKLAKAQDLDLGVIAGHAFIYKDLSVGNLTEPQVQQIMESGDGTYIWPQSDHFAPRWIIRGHSIFEQRLDSRAPGRFNVTCIRHCAY